MGCVFSGCCARGAAEPTKKGDEVIVLPEKLRCVHYRSCG